MARKCHVICLTNNDIDVERHRITKIHCNRPRKGELSEERLTEWKKATIRRTRLVQTNKLYRAEYVYPFVYGDIQSIAPSSIDSNERSLLGRGVALM